MWKIKEILRLKFGLGLSARAIARSCSIPRSNVSNYINRAQAAGLGWPLPPDLDDAAVEKLLFPAVAPSPEQRLFQLPDFPTIYAELRHHKHLTLQLLWQEYKEINPNGYQYSHFCELYNRWAHKLDVVLRQEHRVGERLFVDHAGPTVPVPDRETGEVREASIFVAVLGTSNYTYGEATWKRDLPSWIGSRIQTLWFLQGVTTVIVPDNWKAGVREACYNEPDLNPTYRDFADHYCTVIIPVRVRKPRDKAEVENGVLLVER